VAILHRRPGRRRTLAEEIQDVLRRKKNRVREREIICSCPNCKTFETLWFKGDVLTPTRRFRQEPDGRVYHNCGSDKPCRLIPRFIGEESLEVVCKLEER